MNALKDEMVKMVDEQKKMIDPNHKDDDSEEENSSEEEGHQANQFTFISAIDVGSHFIEINPSNELLFQNLEGNMLTQFTITNPCKACPIAFFVHTSSPIPVKIFPNCGFIPAEFQQVIRIAWQRENQPNVDRLENSMFFVKSLPLSPEMNLDELNQNLS
eukprot:CAMPEP_0168625286 /NCGR_PEP_ID=MMETSP0449_2-20121227/9913_1 /TAXON_ID=1082188 /ORGANISM="Strombidium rassoulzadegani, Strain ras09" /LENGTH=159 /DNA_ID=CAMNT_0008666995 /DNA_START=19 /DNA_END=498 /DNA_ORIENTATION=+